MGFVILICIFPLVWLLLSSFKTNIEILNSAFSWPKTPQLYGYQQAVAVSKIHLRYGTSLIVSASATALCLLIYSMAGYVLARYEFRFKKAIFALLISSLLVPTEAMIQPIYRVVNQLGLYDTKGALILVYTAFGMALCLFLMRSFFADIPKEMEEAACIEGSGFFRTFWQIMLPLAQPALMSCAGADLHQLLERAVVRAAFDLVGAKPDASLMLKYFTSSFSFNYPAMFAALVMYVAPSVLLYVLLQEQIMASMIAGAVKG